MSDFDYDNTLPKVSKLNGKKVNFLLGTDCHIGEGELDERGNELTERRVGITPEQVLVLRNWLQDIGIFLDFYFVQGAGVRAGYSDGDYLNTGGKLVFEHQLMTLQPPHLVHALKEPTPYESFIPGPFMRIGALHLGAFVPTCGLASLFKKKNFCAIFDGSSIGGFSNNFRNTPKIPIRSSMSIFAGEIAADHVAEKLAINKTKNKILISGGGIVGRYCLKRLLKSYPTICEDIYLFELNSQKSTELKEEFKNQNVKIVNADIIREEYIKEANAIVLSANKPGEAAPKVLKLSDITYMGKNSIIVDVSIDEEGGIDIPNVITKNIPLSILKDTIRTQIQNLRKDVEYIADDHMPRRKPNLASMEHGKAVLPYLATLLYIVARQGGAPQAVQYILHNANHTPSNYFEALVCDLKQGLACWRPDKISITKQTMQGIETKMRDFLTNEGLLCEIS